MRKGCLVVSILDGVGELATLFVPVALISTHCRPTILSRVSTGYYSVIERESQMDKLQYTLFRAE